MSCRNALLETQGDIEKALEILKQQSLLMVQKKANRAATEGIIDAYVHPGGRIGAMIEVNCETDFVARTDEFRELAHHLATGSPEGQRPAGRGRHRRPSGGEVAQWRIHRATSSG